MPAYNKFNDFSEQLVRGVHDFDAHTFKVYLSNNAPSASNTVKTDIAEISAGNGYTAGGATTTVTVSESVGTTTVNGTEVVWTATGAVGPFRYAILYNDSTTSPLDALIAWWDYGSSISLANTETFTVRFSNASPGAIFTLI